MRNEPLKVAIVKGIKNCKACRVVRYRAAACQGREEKSRGYYFRVRVGSVLAAECRYIGIIGVSDVLHIIHSLAVQHEQGRGNTTGWGTAVRMPLTQVWRSVVKDWGKEGGEGGRGV